MTVTRGAEAWQDESGLLWGGGPVGGWGVAYPRVAEPVRALSGTVHVRLPPAAANAAPRPATRCDASALPPAVGPPTVIRSAAVAPRPPVRSAAAAPWPARGWSPPVSRRLGPSPRSAIVPRPGGAPHPPAARFSPYARPSAGSPPAPVPRPRRRRGRLATVLLLAGIATAAVLCFVAPGFLVTRVLDDAALVQGVQRVLSEHQRLEVTDVHCPPGVRVVPGAVVTCTATVGGRPATVPVWIADGYGAYEVGHPV